jgi:hypothetical protein
MGEYQMRRKTEKESTVMPHKIAILLSLASSQNRCMRHAKGRAEFSGHNMRTALNASNGAVDVIATTSDPLKPLVQSALPRSHPRKPGFPQA